MALECQQRSTSGAILQAFHLRPDRRPGVAFGNECAPPLAASQILCRVSRKPPSHSHSCDAKPIPTASGIGSAQRSDIGNMRAKYGDARSGNAFLFQRFRYGKQRRSATAGSFVANQEFGGRRQRGRDGVTLRSVESALPIIRMSGRADSESLRRHAKMPQFSGYHCAQSHANAADAHDQHRPGIQIQSAYKVGIVQRM